jgi:Ca2+-binding RTX toxin-like protein
MLKEGAGAVVLQGGSIALVVAFLIGCAVLLVAGASGVQAQASNKEEARCEGTRTITPADLGGEIVTTNDLPGCPKGGLLLGTEGSDRTEARRDPAPPYSLYGGDGDDVIRSLGGSDTISHGYGDDVIYGGDGDDGVAPDSGNDVIYGGPGNDGLDSHDDGGDKLYCGAGRDKYWADKEDYVDSSCETNARAGPEPSGYPGHDDLSLTSSASASPLSAPQVLASGGGPAILPLAAALLFGSGIVTYAILRRR